MEAVMNEMTDREEVWNTYMNYRETIYSTLAGKNVKENIVSEANWIIRSQAQSAADLGITLKQGDICFMDYGQQYLNEMAYQHFGLVINIFSRKAMVVPLTSNTHAYETAYDPIMNPSGKRHLMRIGLVKGLVRPSVLFLNDMRFINTARVIDIKAHIDPDSKLFRQIQQRLMYVMFHTES